MRRIVLLLWILSGSTIAFANGVAAGGRPSDLDKAADGGSLRAPSHVPQSRPGLKLAQFCAPGWGLCPGGGCAPLGSSCCANGRYCNPGFTCCGNGCCAPGFICTRFGCTPPGAIDCGSHWCQPGQRCGSGGGCIPGSAVDCGNGRYCPTGYVCVGASQCMPQHEYDRQQAEIEARRRAEAERQAREAQRREEARKFAEDRDRCRQLRLVVACDAALQSLQATQQDRDELNAWRRSGVQFAADLAACRKRDVAACDAALASPAATDQTRQLIRAWRAQASPLDKARGIWGVSLRWIRERTTMIADLPLPTQIAAGIALALAVILGAVLLAWRRSSRLATAAPGAWSVGAAEGPRTQPVAAIERRHDPVPRRTGAEPNERQSIVVSGNRLPTRAEAIATGVQNMRIIGLSLHGTYGAARGVAGFVSGLGWLLVVAGGLIAFAGLASLSQSPFGGLILISGIAIVATGILQVAAGQLLRASVDSADYARQSLLLQIGIAEGKAEIDLQRALTGPAGSAAAAVPGLAPARAR